MNKLCSLPQHIVVCQCHGSCIFRCTPKASDFIPADISVVAVHECVISDDPVDLFSFVFDEAERYAEQDRVEGMCPDRIKE